MERTIPRSIGKCRYVLVFLFVGFLVLGHYKIIISVKRSSRDPEATPAPEEVTESTKEELTLGMAMDQVKPGSSDHISAKLLRQALQQSNGDFLGGGYVPQKYRDMSMADAQTLFHTKMLDLQYKCKDYIEFGTSHLEGRYQICDDNTFKLKSQSCLVYTYGILRDWTFEEELFKGLKCELHTYDPSINHEDHVRRKPNFFFHNLGVWDEHKVNDKDWSYDTVETMLDDNKHTQTDVDYMKIHIEGSEWPMLNSMIETGAYKNVKQISVVVHSPRWKVKQEVSTIVDYGEIYDIIDRLEGVGFKKWKSEVLSSFCCTWFDELTPISVANKRICCYKLFYVNSKYS